MRNNQRRLGKAAPPSPGPLQPVLAFAVPTEFVELPSRGQFYPEDHPLCNQETVEIKFMTAKDEDVLSSRALIKKGLAIDRFLQGILVEDIDPQTLLVGDRNAILIAARISGYGNEYNVSAPCRACGEENEIVYDLHDAQTAEGCFDKKLLKKEKVVFNERTMTLDTTLPQSGVVVGLSLITGEEEKEFVSTRKEDTEAPITSILSVFVTKVNENMDEEYVAEFINAMPAKDSRHLRSLYPKLVPSVRLVNNMLCSYCLHEEDMEVPLTAEFFWPE